MKILTGTLGVNAVSSGVTGIALTAGAVPLSDWFGIPTWVSLVVGVGLVLFTVWVARTARNPRRPTVLEVIAADIAWVVGAVIVIFAFPGSMSTAGRWALGLVTVAVAAFALFQTLGLRRSGLAR